VVSREEPLFKRENGSPKKKEGTQITVKEHSKGGGRGEGTVLVLVPLEGFTSLWGDESVAIEGERRQQEGEGGVLLKAKRREVNSTQYRKSNPSIGGGKGRERTVDTSKERW